VRLAAVVGEALASLRAYGSRSASTLAGVTWGTAAIVFLVGWGEGLQQMLETRFETMGRNLGVIELGAPSRPVLAHDHGRIDSFRLEDVRTVARSLPAGARVAAESWRWALAARREHLVTVDVRGIEPSIPSIRGVQLAEGRAIDAADLLRGRRVAMLGQVARERIFGHGPVGSRRFRLDGRNFEVVGVLAPIGVQLDSGRSPIDEQVWIPRTTFGLLWGRSGLTDEADRILFQSRRRDQFGAMRDLVIRSLAERLRAAPDDESLLEVESGVEALEQIPIAELRSVLALIALGTLLVAGAGLSTLMLDSVQQRRTEIGLRVALGARRGDVVLQLFAEAMLLTLAGGGCGLAIGLAACAVLAAVDAPAIVPVPIVGPATVLLAVVSLAVAGTASACLPAWRAAQVDPAEALRCA
jgi:putative ABC transport system permease protein